MSTHRIEQAMTKRLKIKAVVADQILLILSQPIHLERTLTSVLLHLAVHKDLMHRLMPYRIRRIHEEASKLNSQSYLVEQTLSLCTVRYHHKSCHKELKFSSSKWRHSTCQSISRRRASARVTLTQPSSVVSTSCSSRCTFQTPATSPGRR